ncbi:MAG: PEP-CTERM sorting domain-containing protein [Akkermansiaceae bacterium]
MKKHICTLLVGSLATISASAATLTYTFETSGNIDSSSAIDPGADLILNTADDFTQITETYSAPDSNNFGAGVSVSAFYMDNRDAEYSRFTDTGGGSVAASVGSGATDLLMSFTISIDSTVSLDLTSIVFDSSGVWARNGAATMFVDFHTTVGAVQGSTSTFDWSNSGVPDYQEDPNNSNSVDLSSLTNLTNTSVTFTWELGTNKNNTFANISQSLDDITLTGIVTPVPEPTSFALLGLGLTGLLARRRRA